MGLLKTLGKIGGGIAKNLPVVGNIVGAAGDIFDAFKGGSSDKWNKQAQANWERSFTGQVQARVADAKAAGISPLAAMGISGTAPANFDTSMPGPGGLGSSLKGIGEAIRSSVDDQRYEQRREDRIIEENRQHQLETFRLDQYGKFLDNTQKEQSIRGQIVGQNFRLQLLRTMMEHARLQAPKPPPVGSRENPHPAQEYYKWPDGRTTQGPSQILAETMENPAAFFNHMWGWGTERQENAPGGVIPEVWRQILQLESAPRNMLFDQLNREQ